MKCVDIKGQKFGRWTVLDKDNPKKSSTMWKCICDCGSAKSVNGKSLRRGLSTSCGCFNTEKARAQGTHGQAGRENGNKETPEYRIWGGMKKRCSNPKAQRYENYGGRGIRVCDRWHSFLNFFEDMGARPSTKHSLERNDNNGNYEPNNCRWATVKEQANNTTRNIILDIDGVKMTLVEASSHFGISYSSVYRKVQSGRLQRA